MAYPCQTRGFLKSKVALIIVAAICFHPDSAKGNFFVVLNEPSGEFRSPGYPDLDDDMYCTWKITAPLYHKITITFLDFQLIVWSYCSDELEIYDGNVKIGTYRGTQLHHHSFTSTSNIVLVVLISCPISFLSDRRGISVSYSTVYETTSSYQTSIKVSTTQTPIATALSIKTTPTETVSTQIYLLSSVYTGIVSSAKSIGQGLIYTLLGALLAAIAVLIIGVILVSKRRKAKHPSRVTTTTSGNIETKKAEGYFTTVVTGKTPMASLDYDYVEIKETQRDLESVYYSRSLVSKSLGFSILQKKHSHFDKSNNLGVYENHTSNTHNTRGKDQDYSHSIYEIQLASPRVVKQGK